MPYLSHEMFMKTLNYSLTSVADFLVNAFDKIQLNLLSYCSRVAHSHV